MTAIINLFYIYDPWFGHFFRMAFFIGIIALSLLAYKIYKKQINGIIIPKDSLIVIIGLIVISTIPFIAHNTKDYSVTIMYIKTLILFTFGIAIYNLWYHQQDLQTSQKQLVQDLKVGIGIQSVVGFIALLGVPLMVSFLLSSNAYMPRFFGSEQEYRLYNITSSAFFQLSIFYLMLLHFLLAYNKKHNTISSVFLFLILFIGLISGRTFLLLSIISIAVYFKWRYIPAIIIFTAVIIFMAIHFADNRYVAHALEPVINLLADKDISEISSSTDNLMKNHLFIPSLSQMLIGDGKYIVPETGGYYGGTDSGFIRQTLYGGIAYMLCCLLFMFYFVKRIADNWFDSSWIFILSTLMILSILNIKADTYAFPGIMLVLIMFLSLFGNSGKNIILFQREKR